jgi:hypothetical protein
MRENTGAKCDLLFQIVLCEAEMAEFQLRRDTVTKIWVQNAQWIEVGHMVTTHLVGTNKELNLAKPDQLADCQERAWEIKEHYM